MSEASALWSTTFAADRIRRYDRAPRIGNAPSCERSLGGYGSPGRCCKEAVEPAPMRLDHFPVRRSVKFRKDERRSRPQRRTGILASENRSEEHTSELQTLMRI